VAAPVVQLTASPTSVSFGNVNLGSTGTQLVTLANTGNANATISQVTPSGTGFSGSGITVPLTLTPGQSAIYTATFTPASTGSLSGQVSFLSNALNSPATVSLSGTGVTTASGPTCGQLNDALVHLPANWASFTAPARGQTYVDPVFGCSVKRITNGSVEEALWDGKAPSLMNFYSTLSAINASDTLLLITDNGGLWRIRDTNGTIVVPMANMPNFNGHPVWDAADGNVFYYTSSDNTLYKGTISGNLVNSTALHTFTEYSGIVSPDAGDLSQDGDHIGLVGLNPNSTMDIFVWSLSLQTKTSKYTTVCTASGLGGQPGCLHKMQLSADNRLTIEFNNDGSGTEQGLRLWTGSTLVHLQDKTSHYDTGFDLNGNPIFSGNDNSVTLPGISSPCANQWSLEVRQINNIQSAICLLENPPSWHISYRGSASQPWLAISFFDTRTPGPEFFTSNGNYQTPTTSNWQLYEDEIILAKVDGSKVYRLAHARSRSLESYWAQPHASMSRDGKYVIFTSNMAFPNGCPANMHVAGDCSDVYLIKIQ